MKRKFLLAIVVVIGMSVLYILPAKADGIIIPDPPICDPCPIPSPMTQLVIRYHHVTVNIENQIATTHVDQVFYNPNDWAVEGVYVFPIPSDAAVSDFVLWMDGEPIKGEVLDAEQARRIYEDIVTNLRDPALLEYADRGALRARVFPIPPSGERRIELEYSQAITAENGLVRYTYPLSTEKFSLVPLEDVSITVDIASSQPIRAVYSPSHNIDTVRDGEFKVRVGYEESDVLPDQDFALYFSIGESEAFHLVTYRDPSNPENPDGFFLLLLAPGVRQSVRAVPKDVMLVLDRSGSMEGEKFSQAQKALSYILERLDSGDRFNLIAFSTGVEAYARNLRPASETEEALSWINRLRAEGSTDINRALLEAVSMVEGERPTYLIFLTDGLPTVGEVDNQRILDNLESSAPKNLRLFAFGVGYDVDTFLLDSLADAHHGRSTYVVPGEQLDEILSTFYSKISTPVLTDLSLDFGDLITYDIYPDPLPDLFAGSQIVVVGRYREGGSADVELRGLANGLVQSYYYRDQIFDKVSSAPIGSIETLPRLWATRKIGYLLNQIRLHGPDQETVDQIVHLSIRYGIITPYTSYLVTEPSPVSAEEQERIISEEFNQFKALELAPSFGSQAVERAEGQRSLADADSAISAPVEAYEKVRVVGSHTFIYLDGVWTDTAYNPEEMETEKLTFLSDDYFRMAESSPELAAAFSLGSRIIVVSGGVAYEVSEGTNSNEATNGAEITPILSPIPPTAGVDISKVDQTMPNPIENSANTSWPCWGTIVVLVLPLLAFSQVKQKSKSRE